MCWGLAKQYTKGCTPMWSIYSYDKDDGEIQCTNKIGTCKRDACLCDKAAIKCFTRNRRTYHVGHEKWKGTCKTTFDDGDLESAYEEAYDILDEFYDKK
jgi:hypothetical protein